MFKNVVMAIVCLLLSVSGFAQYSISGKITDERNQPVVGANIFITQTNNGASSDYAGNYTIPNLKPGEYTLTFSFIGYESLVKYVFIKDENVKMNASLKVAENILLPISTVTANPLRADENTPMTYYNMDKEELEANNLGQDLPYLLQMTPSTVVTSDAGTGIGYTGIRIRGTDPTRINVTVNGVPLNDAESQGVFWVNMPDFASSTGSIQIQRGVGSSTNGAAAFGGTINLETNNSKAQPFVGFSSSIGSFNTVRSNMNFDTGLKKGFNLNGRASIIQSDGYIDRATSDLRSYYLSGSYIGENNSIELINFFGKEVTYQAWYGIDAATLETDRTFNPAGLDATLPYANQVDNYQQNHFQLLYKHSFDKVLFDGALHYTRGKGYYEEYRDGESALDYNLISTNFINDTIETDLVRRRWLDNHFYGATYAFTFFPNNQATNLIVGGAVNNYIGDHFGETIWAEAAEDNEALEAAAPRFYEGTGEKLDFNIYAKLNQQIVGELYGFADLQFRYVRHDIKGIDNDFRDITQLQDFSFFNPKAGFSYNFNEKSNFYASYAMGNREPSRSDLIDAPTNAVPRAETLHDFEFGNKLTYNRFSFNTNVYYMLYDDQLVLTGEINDVGGAIRTNVENSYRLGLELVGGVKVTDWFSINANATFSQNQIIDFVEYLDDWDNGGQITIDHGNTDIAFSPNVIAAAELVFNPLVSSKHDLELALMSKYVGQQFIDNSSSETSVLDAFFTNDIRVAFTPKVAWAKNARFTFLVRNVFNELYESNAWIYRYNFEGRVQQFEGLYPQAGINFFLGVDFKF